jgi:hypothetical protein
MKKRRASKVTKRKSTVDAVKPAGWEPPKLEDLAGGHDMEYRKGYEDRKVGDVIERRADGSFIYMSSRGVLNLDDKADLMEAVREDESLIGRKINLDPDLGQEEK